MTGGAHYAKRAAMERQVKICGLTRREDVEAAVAAGADFLGFIVEAKSSRKLGLKEAAALISGVEIASVAVTVNPDDALVEAIGKAGFSHIQLHGGETLPRVAEIARSGLTVIKASPVATSDEVKLASEFSGAADLLLFDAKPPKGSDQAGGHGLSFNWAILRGAPTPKRWILAGGLTPETVNAAIAATNAPVVDVSSGVETSPGIKDHTLIDAFIRNAKGKN